MSEKVNIRQLATGVPGMDDMLGGGIPEFSFNLIAGVPGSGKTTLAHQMMFAMAAPDCKALFFTVLGEPPLKMLRYQQQFPFFDIDQINKTVKYVNLAADLVDGDFKQVLQRIDRELRDFSPSLVFVDSFRSVVASSQTQSASTYDLQHFIQQLGLKMTSWQATTFLIGEYMSPDAESSPVFTVADGIIWISQVVHRDSMARKIQIVKMRGQAQRLGLHTFRIGSSGIEVFPRTLFDPKSKPLLSEKRLSMGVPTLDRMMGGGLPVAYSLLVVGPSGSGKTVLATEFLAEGVRHGEPGVIAAFEKSPNQLLSHQLNQLITQGDVGLIDTRALDLSIDEILHDLIAMIQRMGAKRVVIDSLSGFELALASVFKENFRESLYRLVAVLTGMGVTVVMTSELEDRYTDLRFSSYGNAFLADAIVMQRYVEYQGQLRRVVSVVKVRASEHSKDIRFYDIAQGQLVIEEGPVPHGRTLSANALNVEGNHTGGQNC
jgi:circadian clock protein KaiC